MSTKFRPKSTGSRNSRQILEHVKHKQPLRKVIFDSRAKGWVGPQKETHPKWAKSRGAVMFLGIRSVSRPGIDLASLVKATKDRMSFSQITNLQDENLQMALWNQPTINKPFDSSSHVQNNAVWTSPKPLGSAKESFDRPKTSDHARLSSAVSNHQAQYLKKILQQKDKEIAMLQKMICKSTEENSKLSKELEGLTLEGRHIRSGIKHHFNKQTQFREYQGKNYDEIYEENIKLKESTSRVSRENAVLRGQLLQVKNPAVRRLIDK